MTLKLHVLVGSVHFSICTQFYYISKEETFSRSTVLRQIRKLKYGSKKKVFHSAKFKRSFACAYVQCSPFLLSKLNLTLNLNKQPATSNWLLVANFTDLTLKRPLKVLKYIGIHYQACRIHWIFKMKRVQRTYKSLSNTTVGVACDAQNYYFVSIISLWVNHPILNF